MSQKSLFAYFKSPKQNTDDKSHSESPAHTPKTRKEAVRSTESSKKTKRDADESPKAAKENRRPKRRRVILSDSEDEDTAASSGEEFKPEVAGQSSSDEDLVPDNTSTPTVPNKRKRASESASQLSTSKLSKFATGSDSLNNSRNSTHSPSVGKSTLSKLSSFSAPPEASEGDGPKLHQTLAFLKPENLKDKERRPISHPDYDCRTVYIPEDFKNSVTPAMRQWWILKEDHFDTILFFKMGKFYEFFHMDADVGVKELGLVYMKGNHAHAGFPEIAYGRYADSLLRKGYKIARIEQTETPDMMNDRLDQSTKKVTKFDKVVKREVCQVTTPGTRTPNFLDGETIDVSSNYLLAVCEKPQDKASQVGVCFVDTSLGKIHLGQFEDDIYGSRLRTLVAHYPPGQVLHERRVNSTLLSQLFKTTLSTVMKEGLAAGKEFWDSDDTLKFLSEADYFRAEGGEGAPEWPGALKDMLDNSDGVSRKAKPGCELAIRCLGAIVWYLRFSFLDQDVLSLGLFSEYIPLDHQPSARPSGFENTRMVLDSVTLANLDILTNQSTGTAEGSLVEQLDRCKTAGGKRLLHEWICAPLCDHRLINDRLEAITNLISMEDISTVQSAMRKLPDFERLLSRIHTLGRGKSSTDHPDNRAIMFEADIYSKRQIDSFLSLIEGFQGALQVAELFTSADITSNLLSKCVKYKELGGHLSDVRPLLKYFEDAFDHQAARKAGAIHPRKGYVEEYDEAIEEIKSINDQLADHLNAQKKLLSSQQVSYVGTGRNRYQLEVPESACKRVPRHYDVSGQRKGFKRYVTTETKRLLGEMMEAEDKRQLALRDTMRRIFQKFDESYKKWMDVVQCMNVLDVLMSLATYTSCNEGVMCKPEVMSPADSSQALIEIRQGRHPSAIKTFGGSDFIPNDTVIGCVNSEDEDVDSTAQLLLLTGPNMGGKSTLMRQVGLLTVMAQVGCYVPAERCRLTAVDRVFTRLGASDRIMHGESTFFVELSETSLMLQHASKHSLVLLDELGRGTSTHDGTAIASAVVSELAEHTKCRTIFSTHYHSLVDDFKANPHVQLGHMACMVNEEEEGTSAITFLYKLAANFCPKSYGFNVAKLAGLPSEVIELGLAKAKELEKLSEPQRFLRSVLMAKQDGGLEAVRSCVGAAC